MPALCRRRPQRDDVHHAVAIQVSYLLVQSAAIIRTDETLSFWSTAVVLEVEVPAAVEVDADDSDLLVASMVPVTSTLCPTCFCRSVSDPSSE